MYSFGSGTGNVIKLDRRKGKNCPVFTSFRSKQLLMEITTTYIGLQPIRKESYWEQEIIKRGYKKVSS